MKTVLMIAGGILIANVLFFGIMLIVYMAEQRKSKKGGGKYGE